MKNWIIGAVLVLLAVAAYYYFGVHQAAEPEVELSTPAPAQSPVSKPPLTPAEQGVDAKSVSEPEFVADSQPAMDEIPLPMLMESDPLVLEKLVELIGEPALIQYVVSDNVISRIVATVDTMGNSQIPGVVQVVQGPESSFEATANEFPEREIFNEEGDPIPQFLIDPVNYRRYTPYVELLEAVDTATLMTNYRSQYTLFQEAYRQMGYAEGAFNDRLITVIDELLAAPEIADPVNLVKPEAFYLFTDTDLESLPAGQKIMLRMGNDNATRVKAKLLEIRGMLQN